MTAGYFMIIKKNTTFNTLTLLVNINGWGVEIHHFFFILMTEKFGYT